MTHPANRGERRFARHARINHRARTIPWAHCDTCAPAPCHCSEHAARRGRLSKTPTPCSCWMCGNPRRYMGQRTHAEHRADLAGRDVD